MTIKVQRIVRGISYGLLPDDDKAPPECCHKVKPEVQDQRARCKLRHKDHPESRNYAYHMEKHPNKCQRIARVRVDGLPFCNAHGGSYLLNLHLKGKMKGKK